MTIAAMNQDAVKFLAARAAEILDIQGAGAPDVARRALGAIVDREVLDAWLERTAPEDFVPNEPRALDAVAQLFDTDHRRARGMFFTPPPLARLMAGALGAANSGEPDGGPGAGNPGVQGTVLDPACGSGALLAAVVRAWPGARVVGIEREPELAIAAALAIVEARRSAGTVATGQAATGQAATGQTATGQVATGQVAGDRVIVGDGLRRSLPALDGIDVSAVVANPPYVGEKGNRAMFDALRREHPDLEPYFAPRMDLLYLFFHRALDRLAPGGRLVFLTSEYWLTATGARRLREDLERRARVEWLLRFESAGMFADAPGHHSLVTVAVRDGRDGRAAPAAGVRAVTVREAAAIDEVASFEALVAGPAVEVYEVSPGQLEAARWAPFVEPEVGALCARLERDGTPLGELVRDYQGFVSGADRLTARHLRLHPELSRAGHGPGEPIFMFRRDELPAALEPLVGTLVRPVLRGGDIVAGATYREPPGEEYALFIDERLSGEAEAIVTAHLAPYRPILAARREVTLGLMPWYRLHWPRDRRAQLGPKLVVPRRAPRPCFCLDLSGSVVSSDCTFLVAPPEVADPVAYLSALMDRLNGAETETYLRAFGKRKGAQLEFYSEPLRALPVVVDWPAAQSRRARGGRGSSRKISEHPI